MKNSLVKSFNNFKNKMCKITNNYGFDVNVCVLNGLICEVALNLAHQLNL